MGLKNVELNQYNRCVLNGYWYIVFLINIIVTAAKKRNAANDPWEDGRTLEWTIPSPAPEYNFAQTPLVRGYDAYWKEKMEGNKEMTPAEPLGSIHMPSPSILPFVHVGRLVHRRLRIYVCGRTIQTLRCYNI